MNQRAPGDFDPSLLLEGGQVQLLYVTRRLNFKFVLV